MAKESYAGHPKKSSNTKFAHTANTPYGMGDYYGTGIKAKLGKMREGIGMVQLTSKKMKTPPKNLA